MCSIISFKFYEKSKRMVFSRSMNSHRDIDKEYFYEDGKSMAIDCEWGTLDTYPECFVYERVHSLRRNNIIDYLHNIGRNNIIILGVNKILKRLQVPNCAVLGTDAGKTYILDCCANINKDERISKFINVARTCLTDDYLETKDNIRELYRKYVEDYGEKDVSPLILKALWTIIAGEDNEINIWRAHKILINIAESNQEQIDFQLDLFTKLYWPDALRKMRNGEWL